MVKRVVVDTIRDVGGILQVRFRKEEVVAGQVVGFTYHRTCVEPGVAPVPLLASISAALGKENDPWPAVEPSTVTPLLARVSEVHTPEKVAEHRARRAEGRGRP
jgi:hypothetical protein